jgi:hypothetical protein
MKSAAEKCAAYSGATLGIDFAGLCSDLEPWRRHGERVAAGAPLRPGPGAPPAIRALAGETPRPFPLEPEDDGAAGGEPG